MFSFEDIIKSIFGRGYYEVAQDTPFIITVTTTPTSVLATIPMPYKWVLSYLVRVRSLGTATYIGIGNESGQDFRLTVIGETYGFAGNPGEICDLTKVFVVSDANTAVIEITALFKPIPMQGDVTLAQRL
jgi:hypothetical protein